MKIIQADVHQMIQERLHKVREIKNSVELSKVSWTQNTKCKMKKTTNGIFKQKVVPCLSHTERRNAYRNTDLDSYNLVTGYFRKIYVTYIPLTNIQVSKHFNANIQSFQWYIENSSRAMGSCEEAKVSCYGKETVNSFPSI